MPDTALPPIAPPLDAKGNLADDATCAGCGYNLRGLSPQANCPECGESIARSLSTATIRIGSNPHWLRRVELGLWMLWGVALVFVGWRVIALETGPSLWSSSDISVAVLSALQAMCLLGAMAGCWLTTTPDPILRHRESRWSGRRLLRWCVSGGLALLFFHMLILKLAIGLRAPYAWTSVTRLKQTWPTEALLPLVAAVAWPVFVVQLARRLPAPQLARFAMLSAIPLLALGLATAGSAYLDYPWNGPWHLSSISTLTAEWREIFSTSRHARPMISALRLLSYVIPEISAVTLILIFPWLAIRLRQARVGQG